MSDANRKPRTDSEMELDALLKSIDDPAQLAKSFDAAFHQSGTGFQPLGGAKPKDQIGSSDPFIAFISRARTQDEKNASQVLVKSQFLDHLPSVSEKGEVRKLTVPEQETVFLLSDSHDVSQLPAGDYLWTNTENGWRGISITPGVQPPLILNVILSNVIICRVVSRRPKIYMSLPCFEAFYPPRANGRRSDQFETDLQSCALLRTEAERKEATDKLLSQWVSVLHSTGLRTLDNSPVGVMVDAELEVVSPNVVARLFFEHWLQETSGISTASAPPNSVVNQTAPSWPTLKQLQQLILGIRRSPGVASPSLTIQMVMDDIRSEVLAALQTGIRQETVERLISKPAQEQKRLASLLRENESLAKALSERSGIKLREVKSVQFFVPMSDVVQKDVADISARRSKLEHVKSEIALEAEELEAQTQKFNNQLDQQHKRAQKVVSKHTESVVQQLKQKAEIAGEVERLESARQQQRLAQEQRQAEFERQRRLDDAKTDLDIRKLQIEANAEEERRRAELQKAKIETAVHFNLKYEEGMARIRQEELDRENKRQLEKLEKEFELQIRTNAAVMEQRLKFLKRFAGLSLGIDENRLLVMALSANPELAGCYVAAMNAKGKDEMIQKMDEFRGQLVAAHGQENQLVHQLWTEGVRQIGHVLGKLAKRD